MSAQTEKVKITCIICPVGCEIELTVRGKEVIDMKGYLCERGRDYAMEEFTAPKRVLTTTINMRNAPILFLPVRTSQPIPKERILPCMGVLKNLVVNPPISIRDIVVKNILGTGVDVVATRSVKD